jgi:GNAT superfamily N-acetyltransferase
MAGAIESMAVGIRRATKDDADIIAGFAIKLVEQHVNYDAVRFSRIGSLDGMADFYRGQTQAGNAAVLVAEVQGEIVGFAYMQYEPIIYAELATKAAWLHDIYVDEPARRSGAGQRLIEGAVDVAKEFGASKLLLSVAAKNASAHDFFEQMGFRMTMHEMMLEISE